MKTRAQKKATIEKKQSNLYRRITKLADQRQLNKSLRRSVEEKSILNEPNKNIQPVEFSPEFKQFLEADFPHLLKMCFGFPYPRFREFSFILFNLHLEDFQNKFQSQMTHDMSIAIIEKTNIVLKAVQENAKQPNDIDAIVLLCVAKFFNYPLIADPVEKSEALQAAMDEELSVCLTSKINSQLLYLAGSIFLDAPNQTQLKLPANIIDLIKDDAFEECETNLTRALFCFKASLANSSDALELTHANMDKKWPILQIFYILSKLAVENTKNNLIQDHELDDLLQGFLPAELLNKQSISLAEKFLRIYKNVVNHFILALNTKPSNPLFQYFKEKIDILEQQIADKKMVKENKSILVSNSVFAADDNDQRGLKRSYDAIANAADQSPAKRVKK